MFACILHSQKEKETRAHTHTNRTHTHTSENIRVEGTEEQRIQKCVIIREGEKEEKPEELARKKEWEHKENGKKNFGNFRGGVGCCSPQGPWRVNRSCGFVFTPSIAFLAVRSENIYICTNKHAHIKRQDRNTHTHTHTHTHMHTRPRLTNE